MNDAVVDAGKRYLPRGWIHLALQLVIWFGFLAAYQVARGLAPHDPARAFANGLPKVLLGESLPRRDALAGAIQQCLKSR